ncbi:hypothetical protein B7463_g8521, partial [Scytalidium lignicola]
MGEPQVESQHALSTIPLQHVKNLNATNLDEPLDAPYDLICVGFGPAALSIAIALHDSNTPARVLFLERQEKFGWHTGMLLPGAHMQISFIKDLATMRDPRSKFTFLNYLHSKKRLVAFTNMSTFTPLRAEFNDYLGWCAGQFSHCVQYLQEAIDVKPVRKETQKVNMWEVKVRDVVKGTSRSLNAKNVILAVGGVPEIPSCLPSHHPKIIHSSSYIHLGSSILPDLNGRYNVAVIGGGQSAAEIFEHLFSQYPNANVTMFTRDSALRPSDDSPFVNEIFDPDRVDTFYSDSSDLRQKTLIANRATNYSVVRNELIERLYERLYQQRLEFPDERQWRLHICNKREVQGVHLDPKDDRVRLCIRDVRSNIQQITDSRYDLVVAATGYRHNGHESLLRSVKDFLPGGLHLVSRDYKLALQPGKVQEDCGIWLQGCCEDTHGLSDSLLSPLDTCVGGCFMMTSNIHLMRSISSIHKPLLVSCVPPPLPLLLAQMQKAYDGLGNLAEIAPSDNFNASMMLHSTSTLLVRVPTRNIAGNFEHCSTVKSPLVAKRTEMRRKPSPDVPRIAPTVVPCRKVCACIGQQHRFILALPLGLQIQKKIITIVIIRSSHLYFKGVWELNMNDTLHASTAPIYRGPSLIEGPSYPPLKHVTLGQLLDQQALARGSNECIVCPSLNTRWTYDTLRSESLQVAQGLLSMGIKPGDRIGILAGNYAEYVAVFFGVAYIGAILVVLNNTYTTDEALRALAHSGCRILFSQPNIGRVSMSKLLDHLGPHPKENERSEMLERIIMLRDSLTGFPTYSDLKDEGRSIPLEVLESMHVKVDLDDVCNFQYTSGSTGNPKAAMLTHFNLVNNAQAIGDRLCFTPADILCCPPPLFHCFGLVLGVLTVLSHGAKIVLPSPTFSASAVLQSLSTERCTALHGVPTMFEELLSLERPKDWRCDRLRTGIIAGAPVPRPLMKRLVAELGMREYTSSYGLTEASPTCFNAFTYDSIHTRLTTVGKLLPHLRAKIVDRTGAIVPQGVRGELCIAGYSLQKGYFNNLEKTNEAMRRDEEGTLWLHTGDEAVFDENGYCSITGRFKDIIIRGGENIYPIEIEERLCAHPAISRAAVVGIRNARYGEVVGAFLHHSPASHPTKPTDEEIRAWTRQTLGRHKAPVHVFWLGHEGAPNEIPQTGSGKVKKFELRALGESIVDAKENGRKLRIEQGAKL